MNGSGTYPTLIQKWSLYRKRGKQAIWPHIPLVLHILRLSGDPGLIARFRV